MTYILQYTDNGKIVYVGEQRGMDYTNGSIYYICGPYSFDDINFAHWNMLYNTPKFKDLKVIELQERQ